MVALPTTDWTELVRRIAADTVSGATDLTRQAAEALIAFADQTPGQTPDELIVELTAAARMMVSAQSVMAPLFNLVNTVLRAVTYSPRTADLRQVIRSTARNYGEGLIVGLAEMAHLAAGVLSPGARVLTHSHSSTVETALLTAHREGRLGSVICTESRPQYEGRVLARRLAEVGIPTTLTLDAGVYSLWDQVDIVLLGADSLCVRGIVNKIGSAGMAAAARVRGVDCYVLAGIEKVWPAALGEVPPIPDRPAEEVWPDVPANIRVVNKFFDVSPWWAISGVITALDVLPVQEAQGLPETVRVHPALRSPE